MFARVAYILDPTNHAQFFVLIVLKNRYSYKSVRRESLTCPALPTPGMKLILAMASAMVKGFFLFHDYKFQEAIQEIPDFAMDLLAAVKVTSQTIAYGEYRAEFKESLSGEILAL